MAMTGVCQPAIFLDKDGTLIDDIPYNVDAARIRLAPGAADALRVFGSAGFRCIVVSNQSGIARGYFAEQAISAVRARIEQLLHDERAGIDGFYYCPHHPEGSVEQYAVRCTCRKPAPGLILMAAEQHQLDLGRSWCVGDILDDVEAGHRAGCRAALVLNRGETEWVQSPLRVPDVSGGTLLDVALRIIELGSRRAASEVAEAR